MIKTQLLGGKVDLKSIFHSKWETFISPLTPIHTTWFLKCAEPETTKIDYLPHKLQTTQLFILVLLSKVNYQQVMILQQVLFLLLAISITKLLGTSLWLLLKLVLLSIKQEQPLNLWSILIISTTCTQIKLKGLPLVLIPDMHLPLTTNSEITSSKTWTEVAQLVSWILLKHLKETLLLETSLHLATFTQVLLNLTTLLQLSLQLLHLHLTPRSVQPLLSSLSLIAWCKQEIPKCSLNWLIKISGSFSFGLHSGDTYVWLNIIMCSYQ